jgi:hypothetical protein
MNKKLIQKSGLLYIFGPILSPPSSNSFSPLQINTPPHTHPRSPPHPLNFKSTSSSPAFLRFSQNTPPLSSHHPNLPVMDQEGADASQAHAANDEPVKAASKPKAAPKPAAPTATAAATCPNCNQSVADSTKLINCQSCNFTECGCQGIMHTCFCCKTAIACDNCSSDIFSWCGHCSDTAINEEYTFCSKCVPCCTSNAPFICGTVVMSIFSKVREEGFIAKAASKTFASGASRPIDGGRRRRMKTNSWKGTMERSILFLFSLA